MSIAPLVSIPVAARHTGIPYATLLRLSHEGEIPTVKIPGRRAALIDIADVEAFIEQAKLGTMLGTKLENDGSKVVENKREPKKRTIVAKRPEVHWSERFTRRNA